MKTCRTCSESKPETEFNKRPETKAGFRSDCRPCQNASSQRWRKNNPTYHYEYDTMRRTQRGKKEMRTWKEKTKYRCHKKNECELCSFRAVDLCQLDIDHIDGNHTNNEASNLQTLCANCHRLKTKLNREGLYRARLSVVS